MPASMREFSVRHERWPVAGEFAISRGARTFADVVVVTLRDNGAQGRGEGVPYGRYGETVPQVMAALEAVRGAVESGATRDDLPGLLPSPAARNALDCALWDLEAKQKGVPVWRLAGLCAPAPLVTAYTLSLAAPEQMARAADQACRAGRRLLKLKLGDDGDAERIRAVRSGAPQARLIIDANEAWSVEQLKALLPVCTRAEVALIEQPLPAAHDEALRHLPHSVPLCADESAHDAGSLASLVGKYDAVNIKTDKTGGLTAALHMAGAARAMKFEVMVGCMLATSLAMAPAMLVAQQAQLVDLDGPLLLARDRAMGIEISSDGVMQPAASSLWG